MKRKNGKKEKKTKTDNLKGTRNRTKKKYALIAIIRSATRRNEWRKKSKERKEERKKRKKERKKERLKERKEGRK